MHPKPLLFLLLLTGAALLKGQPLYQEGYIINSQQETVRGLITDQGEVLNGSICLFRSGNQAGAVEYLPGTILAYGFTEGSRYESKTVELEGTRMEVFAQCLVKGPASLYFLRNKSAEYYFIETDGSGFYTLTPGSGQDVRLLKAIFSDCQEVQSVIDQSQLNRRSLIRITCQYNDCTGQKEACTTYGKSSRWKLRIAPVAGYSFEQFRFRGDATFESFEFDPGQVPFLGLWLDLSSSRLGRHISFQLGAEAAAAKVNYEAQYTLVNQLETDITDYDVHLEAFATKFHAGATYHFTGNRIRPILGGGLLFQKYIRPEFRYEFIYVRDADVETGERERDIAHSLFYGAYVQAGVEAELKRNRILFAGIRAGYGKTNPETTINLSYRFPDQTRVHSVLIPLSFHAGFFF